MATKEEVKELRRLRRPTPVNSDDVPKWFVKRWVKRFGRGEFSHILCDLHVFLGKIENGSNLLDHYGSTVLPNGCLAFVTEPYLPASYIAGPMAAVAKELKCDWYVGDDSWWLPGHTIRGAWFEGDSTTPIEAIKRWSPLK